MDVAPPAAAPEDPAATMSAAAVTTSVASEPSATATPGADPAVQAAISELSAVVGGLSDASRDCIVAAASADPSVADALAAPDGPAGGPAMLSVIGCLTPQESAALTPPGEGPPPDPADIACLMEALSGEPSGERILDVLTGADMSGEGLTLEQSAVLGEAVALCGIETGFGFGDPADADGALPAVGGGWGPCTVGLILYPGDECDLDGFIMTVGDGGNAVLEGSLGGVAADGIHAPDDRIDLGGFVALPDGATWTIQSLP